MVSEYNDCCFVYALEQTVWYVKGIWDRAQRTD